VAPQSHETPAWAFRPQPRESEDAPVVIE
jgi:hypothetical protein